MALFNQKYPVGVSLKTDHYPAIKEQKPALDFFEIHAENYMMDDGPHMRSLLEFRKDYDISVHGVGLSLGSAGGIDAQHLSRLRTLVDRIDPFLVSEHLAWSVHDGKYLNDLLPVPLTEESLKVLVRNIIHMQEGLERQILIENPSNYLAFEQSSIAEAEFLNTLVDQTGCGLLLDINNIYVSSKNIGFKATDYLDQINLSKVQEVHLAGHTVKNIEGREILIDDHGAIVSDQVWDLYDYALSSGLKASTLIEWDSNLPAFDVFMIEAEQIKSRVKNHAAVEKQSA